MKKLSILASLFLILCLFSACSGKVSKQLIGSWSNEEDDYPIITFYDDGTCDIVHEYGTGLWAVVNENQVKVSNFYGETDVYKIVSIDKNKLSFERVRVEPGNYYFGSGDTLYKVK